MSTSDTAQPIPDAQVTLQEITAETLGAVLRLEVSEAQRRFVAPNAVSIAEAHFEPKSWFRAIYANDTPVGFVMLYVDIEQPQYYLWRFMIDSRYQGQGFARQALDLVCDHVRTLPQATELKLSYVPGSGSPLTFYRKQGFVDTGEIEYGELMMRKYL